MKVYKLRVQVGGHVSTRLGTCINGRWYGADRALIDTENVIERYPAGKQETKDFVEIYNEQ